MPGSHCLRSLKSFGFLPADPGAAGPPDPDALGAGPGCGWPVGSVPVALGAGGPPGKMGRGRGWALASPAPMSRAEPVKRMGRSRFIVGSGLEGGTTSSAWAGS